MIGVKLGTIKLDVVQVVSLDMVIQLMVFAVVHLLILGKGTMTIAQNMHMLIPKTFTIHLGIKIVEGCVSNVMPDIL